MCTSTLIVLHIILRGFGRSVTREGLYNGCQYERSSLNLNETIGLVMGKFLHER